MFWRFSLRFCEIALQESQRAEISVCWFTWSRVNECKIVLVNLLFTILLVHNYMFFLELQCKYVKLFHLIEKNASDSLLFADFLCNFVPDFDTTVLL